MASNELSLKNSAWCHLAHAIKTKAYDVIDVRFFRKLIFLRKRGPNLISTVLLIMSPKKRGWGIFFSTLCGSVVDHYHIGVEIHQITQIHKKVNKIHLKKDACICIKKTHQPLWLHIYSDSDSLIWWKREYSIYLTQNIGISSITSWQGELSYHWYIKDKLTHSPHSPDYDTDHSLMYSNVKLQIRDE